jgi:lipopolysaccharide transport system permease protein
MSMIRALWAYRGFIFGSVKREFQSKYRNSLLGAAWNIINPLAMIVVYTVIFAEVMRAKLPGVDGIFAYSIYLCAGVLTWGLFTEMVGRSQTMFLDNANLLKKISFPRITLPIIVVANAVLNFAIVFGLFLAFLVISGNFPGWVIVAILPILALQIAFAMGLGMVLGVLNVFFRDVGHFFGIFLQFWFWLTPIVYPAGILPDFIKPYMDVNPMVPLISAYQGILVNQLWPSWSTLLPTAVVTCLLCSLGLHLFKKNAGEMVDEL